MRVLMISADLDKGGIGSVVMMLYRSLIVNGISCDLTYYEGNEPSPSIVEELSKNNSKVWRLKNFKSVGFVRYIVQIKDICKLNKYDVVHIHTSLLIWVAGLGARLSGVKKIVGHAHGAKFLNYSPKILFLLEPIGRIMNQLVCTDFVACSQISAQYTFKKEATFIPNYVPVNKIENISKEQINEARRKVGFEDGAVIFGYIGCLDGVKKADFIIDVIEKLRILNVNATAFLAGNTENKEHFLNLIHEKKLDKYVKLLGFRKDCDVLIQSLDYYITASESEGMSVSLVQAQMAGKPCITSSLLPLENDLKIDLTLRIDGYDAYHWADEIEKEINRGFVQRKREIACKKVVESEFGEKIAIKKLIDIYKV